MKYLMILTYLLTILETYKVSLYFLRKDKSKLTIVLECFILLIILLISYLFMEKIFNTLLVIIAIMIDVIVIVSFVLYLIKHKNYITTLSVKKSIDMSSSGILFLNKDKDIMLINNIMKEILDDYSIKNNFLNELISVSFRKVGDVYLIKSLDKIWKLNIKNNYEFTLVDITEIYNLQEEEEKQNKLIEENNKKILTTINNMEQIEKEKNILKLKNEYHDLLGHRLALFNSYMDKDKVEVDNIRFLLDKLYGDEDNSKDRLNELVKMYKIVGVNIDINGKVPTDEKISNVVFEIIRESVTNAIIHADSKNVCVNIINYLDRIEINISNDGKKPSKIIHENEGIKGIRRKLKGINGTLDISLSDKFILKIIINRS